MVLIGSFNYSFRSIPLIASNVFDEDYYYFGIQTVIGEFYRQILSAKSGVTIIKLLMISERRNKFNLSKFKDQIRAEGI